MHRDDKKVHFGQVGLLALPGWVTAPVLEQWMQEARDFAAEWAELRPLHQNKLCGRCLRAPLQVCSMPLSEGDQILVLSAGITPQKKREAALQCIASGRWIRAQLSDEALVVIVRRLKKSAAMGAARVLA